MITMAGVFRLNVKAPKGRVYVDIEYMCDFDQIDGDSVDEYPMIGYWSHWSRGLSYPWRERLVPTTNHGLKLFEPWWGGKCHVDMVAYRGDWDPDGGSVSLKLQRRTRR